MPALGSHEHSEVRDWGACRVAVGGWLGGLAWAYRAQFDNYGADIRGRPVVLFAWYDALSVALLALAWIVRAILSHRRSELPSRVDSHGERLADHGPSRG